MNELSPLTIGLIAAAVVLLVVVIILITKNSGSRKAEQLAADRERAAELRRDIDRERVEVQEQELQAHETELAAERARLDAKKARVDADRLEHAAADQRAGLGDAQTHLDDRVREADEIDPDVSADGRSTDVRRGEDPLADRRVDAAGDARATDPRHPDELRDPDDPRSEFTRRADR